MKRIACFTTSRSDYAPSCWLLHDLAQTTELLLVVAGSHLDPRHGETIRDIERDGFAIARTLAAHATSDDPASYAAFAAALLTGSAQFLIDTRPDLVVLYGDRLELLPIATAAVVTRTPIAHICGGDVTYGALDEQVRHATTKMAHLHFPSTAASAARLLRMGEEPWRVHCTGDPALDDFVRGSFPDSAALAADLGFQPDQRTILLTVHPETAAGESDDLATAVASAVMDYDGWIVITGPGADPGSERIRQAMIALSQTRPRTIYREHLGAARYRGLMRVAGAIAGNSSSALIEAATVPTPAVNVGIRQAGRERNANVIDCEADPDAIRAALARAVDPAFRKSLTGTANVYGDGHSTARIIEVLQSAPDREVLLRKVFVDG